MNVLDVKNLIGEELKKKLQDKSLSWDRVQEIAEFIERTLPNDITDEKLKELIPTLDDNFKELNGLVMKLIAS